MLEDIKDYIIIGPFIIIIFALYLYNTKDYSGLVWYLFWYSVSIFVSILIVKELNKYTLLENIIPNQRVKSIFLFIIVALPIFAYAYGKIHSHDILNGRNCFYVDVSIFRNKEMFQDQKNLKYLGLEGEYLFFMSEDNTKYYITKFQEIPIVELHKLKSKN